MIMILYVWRQKKDKCTSAAGGETETQSLIRIKITIPFTFVPIQYLTVQNTKPQSQSNN
jgi:hypothetical protein